MPRPTDAAMSTFKVEVLVTVTLDELSVETGWSGTAWAVKEDRGDALFMTAGHVCNTTDLGVPVTKSAFSLVSRDGQVHVAEVVRFTADPEPDLCLLRVRGLAAQPLALASEMPAYGDEVGYTGAPDGIYGGGMAPLYRGFYAGDNLASIPTAPGASGSAMYSSSGVFGVLVAVDRRFSGLTYFEPLDHLRAFLAQ
jgi:trypsin-like peptidase